MNSAWIVIVFFISLGALLLGVIRYKMNAGVMMLISALEPNLFFLYRGLYYCLFGRLWLCGGVEHFLWCVAGIALKEPF